MLNHPSATLPAYGSRDTSIMITPEVADELRAMHAIARTVNGHMPVGDPRRKINKDFTEALAALVGEGISFYRLAKILGVHGSSVRARLARHGYCEPSPSLAGRRYRNTTIQDARRDGQARKQS